MTPAPSVGQAQTQLAITFAAIGTTCRLVVTHPSALIPAQTMAMRHLAQLDRAASRFRPDSLVSLLGKQAQQGPVDASIDRLLTDYLQASLRVARLTEGLVDPSVGAALIQRGYDRDMEQVRQRNGDLLADPAPAQLPGWQQIELDVQASRLRLPQGLVIDVGASAKAHAADTIAAQLQQYFPGGFLLDLGGDIAVSGEAPAPGWRIGITDPYALQQNSGLAQGKARFSAPTVQTVVSTGQAIATSSTQLRTWSSATAAHHHILDPRTGQSAQPVWLQVSVAAANALEANAASTAAIILGHEAPQWLQQRGIAALLAGADGRLHVSGSWPQTDLRADREVVRTGAVTQR